MDGFRILRNTQVVILGVCITDGPYTYASQLPTTDAVLALPSYLNAA